MGSTNTIFPSYPTLGTAILFLSFSDFSALPTHNPTEKLMVIDFEVENSIFL